MNRFQSRIAFLSVVVVLMSSVLLQTPAAAETKGNHPLPRFEDYPLMETWQGPTATLKIKSRSERMFRTQFTEAAKKPPNFAGHYRFVDWGCGMHCSAGALIDLKTGKIGIPPLAKNVGGWDHWIFCASLYDKCGIEYRPDSRLMIIRCGGGANEAGENTPDVYFFLWERDHFRRLVHVPGRGEFSLG